MSGPVLGRVTIGGLSGRGTVTYAEVVRQVDQPGLSLSAAFSFTYRLRGLPEGVVIRSIDPAGNGFVVRLAGADVSVGVG